MSRTTNIVYTIEFFSYWHIGSGLSIAGDVDAAVLKNQYQLPYIPGKALKGLLREAAETLAELDTKSSYKDLIVSIFGEERTKKQQAAEEKEENTDFDPDKDNETKGQAGQAFFYNAEVNPKDLMDKQTALYERLSATALDEQGQAKQGSLRKMEVSIPLKLYAKISGLTKEEGEFIHQCFKWIKRMGLQRHRGLGRCQFQALN